MVQVKTYLKNKPSKLLTMLFMGILVTPQILSGSEYEGRSPYRLIFVEHSDLSVPFDPNQNLLAATTREQNRDLIKKKVLGSVVKGLLPMSGQLGSALSDPQTDFLTSVTSMGSILSKELGAAIESFSAIEASTFPVVNDVYLIPWQTGNRNLFYGGDKISMGAEEVANVLASSSQSDKFEKDVTAQIKDLQKLRFNTENPVYLLGARSYIFVNPRGESNLVVSVLLALKPSVLPFSKSNDQITFERINIPGNAEKTATAKLVLTLPLLRSEAPVLDVEFGEFESFSQGTFKLKESGRQNMSPGMEGRSTKGSVPLTFSFSKLRFDLETLDVSGLNVLTSMGFLTKRGRLPIGGFKVNAVNNQFQQEINNTIDAEVKAAQDAGLEAVESKLFTDSTLKEALEAILGRAK